MNRAEYLRKQRERRELDKVRFIRSMQMLQFGGNSLNPIIEPSYRRDEDEGITEYRKQTNKTMREKAEELERKLNHRPVRVWSVCPGLPHPKLPLTLAAAVLSWCCSGGCTVALIHYTSPVKTLTSDQGHPHPITQDYFQ